MPAVQPPITTLAVIKDIQGGILQDFTESGEHLSVILFATCEIVTTPYVDGSLSVTRWLCDDLHLNYYISSSETTFDLKMPVNHALLNCCAGAAENHLLRGNVIVVKHRQSSRDKFEDMTAEDMALVASVVGSAVGGALLDCVDEYDMAFNAIEL